MAARILSFANISAASAALFTAASIWVFVDREPAQHVILQLARLPSDADPQSRELEPAELLDNRLQPVVAARGPAGAHPQTSQRQIRIVDDDEHVRRRELVKTRHSRTAHPLRFMKVVGSASSTPSPISAIFAARAFHFEWFFNVTR